MSVDLSDIVTAIDYDDPNEWSLERLDAWLREHDLPATCKDGKNHFKLCPLCNESEGNAACWIPGRPTRFQMLQTKMQRIIRRSGCPSHADTTCYDIARIPPRQVPEAAGHRG